MKTIIDAFVAFNSNGLNYLLYTVMNNWWFILIAAGAVCSIVLSLKEEIQLTVTEEQQIL